MVSSLLGEDTYFVADADGAPGQVYSLGLVLLEDETERAALHQGSELCFEVFAQLWVGRACLPQQVSQS